MKKKLQDTISIGLLSILVGYPVILVRPSLGGASESPAASFLPNRPPHEHLKDLAGNEEVVKNQILTFLRVLRDTVHVAPKKAPGFLGYSSSSSFSAVSP
jgi:hypothetical protein